MGLYIYGVVGPISYAQRGGVRNSEVTTLVERDVGLIVSHVEDEVALDLHTDALAHQRVLENVLASHTVLPVSFGSVAVSENAARKLLREHHLEFLNELRRLSGKVEADVKVFWEKEAVLEELAPVWGSIDELKSSIAEDQKKAMEISLQFGKALADVLEQWKMTHIAKIANMFQSISLDAKYGPLISVRMLLNAAYLVDREKGLTALQQKLQAADSEFGKMMRFHLTAPLPPYNFIKMRISLEETDA